jgi:hypothetical protein
VHGISLLVFVAAQELSSPSTLAFERAARGALGSDADVRLLGVDADPADDEAVARGGDADGVVELNFGAGATKARIHCYVARERRWVDREITFSTGNASAEREAVERGRLLGFAVATMFAEDASPTAAAEPEAIAPVAKPAESAPSRSQPEPDRPRAAAARGPRRDLEFAGIVSSGVRGTAAGVGAEAGLRLAWAGPVWGRLFVAGRAGNIPPAQASTRTVLLGGGIALKLWSPGQLELGARLDAFASYFEASHLSGDDLSADRKSRWLPGADLLAEAGFRIAGSAGLFAGCGLEAMLGRTEIYTHGSQVAVVPPLRVVAELGFRTGF